MLYSAPRAGICACLREAGTREIHEDHSCREGTVGELPAPLFYLLASWGAVTSVLVVLVIYRATLSTREDDEIHLNKTADSMMAAEQRQIVGKLNKLTRPIVTLV